MLKVSLDTTFIIDKLNEILNTHQIILFNQSDIIALKANVFTILSFGHINKLVKIEMVVNQPGLCNGNYEVLMWFIKHVIELLFNSVDNMVVFWDERLSLD